MIYLSLLLIPISLLAAAGERKSVKTYPWKDARSPVEIITIDTDNDGKVDRTETFYEDREKNLRIRKVEKEGKSFVTHQKLIQEDACSIVVASAATALIQDVESLQLEIVNGYYVMAPNHKVHKSCFERWGKDNFISSLKKATGEKLSCLDRMASTPTVHANHATEIAQNLRALWQKSTVHLQCNEERNWATSAAHASSTPDSQMPKLPLVRHPYISVATDTPKIKGGPTSTEISNFTSTLFHESIHNLGHRHGEGVEYTYACESCCHTDTTEKAKVAACKVCVGDYAEGAIDKAYVSDMVAWGNTFDANLRGDLPEVSIINYVAETSDKRFGLLAMAQATSNPFNGVGLELAEIFKTRYPEKIRDEMETEAIDILSFSREFYKELKPFNKEAKVIANSYVNFYIDQSHAAALASIEENKKLFKSMIDSRPTGNNIYIVDSMKGHLKTVLTSMLLRNYPDSNPESTRAGQLMEELGI